MSTRHDGSFLRRTGTSPSPRRLCWIVASVLAVAGLAAATPTIAGALAHRSPAGSRAERTARHSARGVRTAAAAGTALSGCAAQASSGGLGDHWQAGPATHAGPLWFIDGGHSRGPLRLYVAVVVLSKLRAGSRVVVRVAPAGRGDLRFLYGPADSLNPGVRHTMASGEAGVTFVACRSGLGAAGITDYYGGFLIRGARCVPVQAWVPGRASPVALRLGACPGH